MCIVIFEDLLVGVIGVVVLGGYVIGLLVGLYCNVEYGMCLKVFGVDVFVEDFDEVVCLLV